VNYSALTQYPGLTSRAESVIKTLLEKGAINQEDVPRVIGEFARVANLVFTMLAPHDADHLDDEVKPMRQARYVHMYKGTSSMSSSTVYGDRVTLRDVVCEAITMPVYDCDRQPTFKRVEIGDGNVTLYAAGEYVASQWDRSMISTN
jgi:hypothetical protein